MTFEMFFAAMVAMMFGTALIFWGYRLFMVLLPFWGFFFGFVLGAQSMQVLFNQGFLATATSWVVGFLVGALFAVLSYLFYFVAIGLMAGSLGYALGTGLMDLFIPSLTFVVWLVGVVFAIGAIAVVFAYNVQKYMIILATSFHGAAIAVGTLLLGALGVKLMTLYENPVQTMLGDKPFFGLFFLILFIGGVIVQIKSTEGYTIEEFENRI